MKRILLLVFATGVVLACTPHGSDLGYGDTYPREISKEALAADPLLKLDHAKYTYNFKKGQALQIQKTISEAQMYAAISGDALQVSQKAYDLRDHSVAVCVAVARGWVSDKDRIAMGLPLLNEARCYPEAECSLGYNKAIQINIHARVGTSQCTKASMVESLIKSKDYLLPKPRSFR